MSTENQSRLFIRICAPILLVMAPLFLYGFFSAPNPSGDEVSVGAEIIVSLIAVGAFVLAVVICKREFFSAKG